MATTQVDTCINFFHSQLETQTVNAKGEVFRSNERQIARETTFNPLRASKLLEKCNPQSTEATPENSKEQLKALLVSFTFFVLKKSF